ncbi:uncharacterized protein LOC130662966 [Microplitis mediator]|uniref:uncharacterized protein LOC130662966 n=1 Tax=Microplitis mediator TaxID=375433 RepID=UPI0025541A38|nr:uncharacterized protein LOC130662966 [Microplitis mediator]
MFKLFVVAALVAVAVAEYPHTGGHYLAASHPVYSIHEKTIESHGNSVVHSSAPVVHTVPVVPVVPYVEHKKLYYKSVPTHVISEKTVSNHGHSIVHNAQPVISSVYVAPAHYV